MQLVPLVLQVVEELIDAFKVLVALPEQRPILSRQLRVGGGQADSSSFHPQQHLLLPPVCARLGPGLDGAVHQSAVPVRDNQIFVVPQDIAEPLAVRTGTQGMVKGEQDRSDRLEGPSAALAAKARAV